MKKPPEGGFSFSWSPGAPFCSHGFYTANLDPKELNNDRDS